MESLEGPSMESMRSYSGNELTDIMYVVDEIPGRAGHETREHAFVQRQQQTRISEAYDGSVCCGHVDGY